MAAFLSEPRFEGLPCVLEGPGRSGKGLVPEDLADARAAQARAAAPQALEGARAEAQAGAGTAGGRTAGAEHAVELRLERRVAAGDLELAAEAQLAQAGAGVDLEHDLGLAGKSSKMRLSSSITVAGSRPASTRR